MFTKTVLISALASVLLTSTAFAAGNIAKSSKDQITGIKYMSRSASAVRGFDSCQYHASDVCINNYSSQPITFNVPAFNQSGQLYSQWSADVYSNYYYPYIGVQLWNAYNQPIFNQPVSNYSIINITNSLTAKGTDTVTVMH